MPQLRSELGKMVLLKRIKRWAILYRSFLKIFEGIKLPRFESQFLKLNDPAHSAPTLLIGQIQNTFKHLHLKVDFSK